MKNLEELEVIFTEDYGVRDVQKEFREVIAQSLIDYYALMQEIDSRERVIQLETHD